MRALLTMALLLATLAPALAQSAPTAQEQIERTIGSLVVQNATLAEQLQKAQAEIARLQQEIAKPKKDGQ